LLFVLGDPAYYTRSGFVPALPLGLRAPYDIEPEAAWMVRDLASGAPAKLPAAVRCADALAPEQYWRE
jgi:putative acetyltransferase